MGFFSWLGKIFDQLIAWLGEALAIFVNALVNLLGSVWDVVIVGTLTLAFGAQSLLYTIFYAGEFLNEVLMEVWDPASNKPSELFKLRQAPANTPLPKQRSEAKVVVLENWG